MRRRRGYRGRNYKFTEKTQSGRAIISIILSALSLVSCCVMIGISFQNRGNAALSVGSAGVFGMLLEVIACIVAFRSLLEPEKFKLIPYISIGLSIIMLLIWIALYIGGI